MQALRGLTEHSGVKSERSRFLESDLRKLLVWRKRVATGDPEATDLPFEITVMLLAPRRALPPTVQLALQIPFPPSLLRQTSVREPVRLVRTPLSRCFPIHRRK